MKKLLIVLFLCLLIIGFSFSSAMKIDYGHSERYNDIIEGCECNEVNNADVFELNSQLNKLEIYSKLLLVLSRNNPKIRDICADLSDLTNSESNWKFSISCFILEEIFYLMNDTISFILEIYEEFPYGGILYQIAVTIGGIAVYISVYVVLPIALYFGCDWIPYPVQIIRDNPFQ